MKRQECMVGVFWSGRNDAGDDGRGHRFMRKKRSADLGLDQVPDPPFTDHEMENILFAAKMAAIRCLHARKGGR